MATTIRRNLFDRLIKRQIAVGRYGEKQVRDTISLLNQADAEIIAKISARGETKSFTGSRLKRLLAETKKTIAAAYESIGEKTRDDAVDLAENSAEWAGGLLSSQLPAKWSPIALSVEQLAAIVDETPIAIGKDKRLLLEEIFSSMAAGKEEAIRGALRLGMVQGETVDQMVRRLRGTRAAQYRDGLLEGSRRSMASIVRSVVQSTNNTAAQAVFDRNDEVLNGWVYVATLDSRTCPLCYSKSGKKYRLGEGPLPTLHPGCRCFQAPDIKTWEELGFGDLPEFGSFQRASKSGPVDADISFNDWLKDQDYQAQVELLGPARAKLFNDGILTLDKFTDSSGELYTLDELAERTASAPLRSAAGKTSYLAREYTSAEIKDIFDGLKNARTDPVGGWLEQADLAPVEGIEAWAKKTKSKLIDTGCPPGRIIEIPKTVKESEYEQLLEHARALYQAAKPTDQVLNAGYIRGAIEVAAEEKKYSLSVQLDAKNGIIGAASMEPYPDSIRIELLGGLGGGAGASCLLSAIRASEKLGKKGAITLTPVAAAVSWYDRQGFVGKTGSRYGELWLSPEAAAAFKKRMAGKK